MPGTGGSSGGNNQGSRYYKHMYTIEDDEIEVEDIGYIVIGDIEIPVDFK